MRRKTLRVIQPQPIPLSALRFSTAKQSPAKTLEPVNLDQIFALVKPVGVKIHVKLLFVVPLLKLTYLGFHHVRFYKY